MKIIHQARSPYVFLSGFLFWIGMTILLSGGSIQAQTYLIIEKPGKVKNFKIKPGSTLRYLQAGQKEFSTGTISRLTDSVIFMNEGNRVPISSITAIKMDQAMFRILTPFFALGGVGYLGIDVVNNLINNIGPVFNQKTMLIAGSLVATSIIFRSLSRRTLHMGKPWRLKVIDMANPPILDKQN